MITKDWEILHSFDDFETFDKLSDTEKRIYCDFCLNIMGAPFVRPFLFPLKFPLFVVNQGRRAHSIPTLIILPL